MTGRTELHCKVDMVVIAEEAIKFDNTGMINKKLNFNLVDKLPLTDIVHLLFFNLFQGEDNTRAAMFGQIYLPILSRSNFPSNFKILKSHLQLQETRFRRQRRYRLRKLFIGVLEFEVLLFFGVIGVGI